MVAGTSQDAHQPGLVARGIFDRIVCGVDLSAASLEATRQAARLVSDDGSLLLVSVAVGDPVAVASPAGLGATVARTRVDEQARAAYRAALAHAAREARATCPRTRIKIREGDPITRLLEAITAGHATLVVAGSHDYHRMSGIVIGSVATHLLHRARCSVLIACPPKNGLRRVLVGIDGSPESELAARIGGDLADRFDMELKTVFAYGGKPVRHYDAVDRQTPAVETFDEPVHALVSRARGGDLIVLGSRGLHGLRALGSVSERVAHRAPCSVLVVRAPQETR
jgi:nucleotide-binding universal stress UspA family protein